MMKRFGIKKIISLVLAVGCGVLFGQLIIKSFTKLTLSDFHVYYYVTKAVMKYNVHPYSNFTPIYPYYFPPASLILFWPMTVFPFYLAKIFFTVLNSGLLVLSIYLINKMLIGKIDYHFWLMLFLSLIFYPLRFTFADGQFNVVMLAIFTLGLYGFYKNKAILGGFSLGLGVITKISPAIALIYGIYKKKFNLVMVAGIVVIILSLMSENFVRKDINYYYAKFIVKDVSAQSRGHDTTDQSLLALIKRYTHEEKIDISSTQQSIVSYSIIAFLGLVFFIIDLKAKKGKYNMFIDYFILTVVGVIGTGLAWYHQYTILLLPLFGTAILIFTRFNKEYKAVKFVYLLGIILVYLSWFMDLRSKAFSPEGYCQFVMLYGGGLFLLGLFFLKINQKWLLDENLDSTEDYNRKAPLFLFIAALVVVLNPVNLSQVLKEGRDDSRVKALNYMSGVLKKKKVTFKVEESNSFVMSNRVGGKGYIRFGKKQEEKVLDRMYILYEDPINNEEYNYRFVSEDGLNFKLGAKLESNLYKSLYGDFYWVGSE